MRQRPTATPLATALVVLTLLAPAGAALLTVTEGGAAATAGADGLPVAAAASQSDEHVVVAVVDTGINPYHEFFRAPDLVDHPSTWLADFPASADAVSLTFGHATVGDALDADATEWERLQRSSRAGNGSFVTHLYTFPGTRIVGGVSFGEYEVANGRPVFDEHGHGTHSAGLVAGADMATPDANVLVVMVEVGSGQFLDGVRWAAEQPFIDALSLSIGVIGNVPSGMLFGDDRGTMAEATRIAHDSGKPVFVASGNGFSGTGLAPDSCSTYTSHYTGPPWVLRVGAAEPRTNNPTWWHCNPVDVVGRTNVASPSAESMTASSTATGTSAATPNVAGHFAELALRARRAGFGPEWNHDLAEHLLNASHPARPSTGLHMPGLHGFTHYWQGYGLVNEDAVDRAWASWQAGTGPERREDAEPFFAADAAVRSALWTNEVVDVDLPALEAYSNDAASGRDAGAGPNEAVPVDAGIVHDATMIGAAGVADAEDWFAFDATAGDAFAFRTTALAGCYGLVRPDGSTAVGTKCWFTLGNDGTLTRTLDESGTWFVRFTALTPQAYRFAFDVNGPAPDLLSP